MDFSSQRIVIIDYGMGNVGSINNMLKYLGTRAVISADREDIKIADKLILPGVGHFDRAMDNINNKQLLELLNEMALIKKVPFLGICLGMQLMCNSSEEGSAKGLGFVDAAVKRFSFPDNNELKIPHMGWNYINPNKKSDLLKGVPSMRLYISGVSMCVYTPP
jgi:glutamine amidotransferase